MDSLDRINLRLDWARFHLEKLKDEVDAFTAGKPYSTRQETYVEGDYEVIELRMLIERQPPDILSLIMGDFVHNLRSLLDHIAWSMIPAGSKPQQPRNIAFPIFAKASGSEPCFDIDGRRMIQELRPEAKSIFESLQPYQGWKPSTRSPLWILNKLWNIDKHRNIMPVTLYHSPAKFPVLYPPGIVRHIKTTPEIDRDNAIIAWLYIPPGAELKYKCEVTTEIVFDEPGELAREDILSTLHRAYNFVRDEVIPAFAPLLA